MELAQHVDHKTRFGQSFKVAEDSILRKATAIGYRCIQQVLVFEQEDHGILITGISLPKMPFGEPWDHLRP